MPIQELKDIKLYYDEYGSGDNYLICAQQNHSKIRSYVIELAKHGFHVINIQIRGYGKSTHVFDDPGYDWYETWAKDVIDFADAKCIEKFFYTGVSHGAGIGWLICYNYPERVRGFFSIVGGPLSKDGKENSDARRATIEAAGDPEKWKAHAAMMTRLGQRPLNGSESEEEIKILNALSEESFNNWASMSYEEIVLNPKKPFPKIKTEEELIEALKTIKVPTLIIGGMKDTIVSPENLVRSCKAVEGSKLIMYEDATHAVGSEKMAEVIDDILKFVRHRKLI